MKTTMKQLAGGTFIALLLLVGNVKAEGTETKASSQVSIETTLRLEKWMTDETLWNPKSSFNIEIIQETDSGLALESWMTSEKTWDINNNFVQEAEEPMELECWMTCKKIWNGYNNAEETETELTVENWMTNDNIWNR